jgi:hypothetical protein
MNYFPVIITLIVWYCLWNLLDVIVFELNDKYNLDKKVFYILLFIIIIVIAELFKIKLE